MNTHTDLPDTPVEDLPAPEYVPQDGLIDRRSFLVRAGALGAAGVALSQLPPIAARPAKAHGKGSPLLPFVRPEAQKDPTECTVAEAATLIALKRLKPSELTEAYLDRIARFDTDYWQAYLTVLGDEALARARQLDRARPKSSLHGVSIPVKDNFYTKGVPTTAQSLIFADFVPDVDSTAVARIEAAGGIVLGKLAMGPLAGGRPRDPLTGVATTRNAWSPDDPGPSPSGSSGGSGCATAARLATCTLGTQTGGSITGPGQANGLTALKPTHGRCSSFGVIPLTITRDHIGPLARDAKDAAIVTEVLAGPALEDPRTIGLPPVPDLVAAATPVVRHRRVVPRWKLKVGVLSNFVSGTSAAALARADLLDTLANIGYEVVEVTIPEEYALLSGGPFNVSSSERAEMDYAYLREDVRLFGDRLTGWVGALMLGGAEVAKGLRCKLRATELAFSELFSQCDVIFSSTGFDSIGFPIATLPIGFAPNNAGIVLPIATQLGAPAFGEEKLLSVIAAFQAVTDHHLQRPPDPTLGLARARDPGTQRIKLTCRDIDALDESLVA